MQHKNEDRHTKIFSFRHDAVKDRLKGFHNGEGFLNRLTTILTVNRLTG